ncbi:MAG: hypothetical protein RMK62_12385, partial [Armatimonadota bacterium]|nr:hypothetical protein [Armatimonadota bacterium]
LNPIGGVMTRPVTVRRGIICEIGHNVRFTDPLGRSLHVGSIRFCYLVYLHGGTVKSTFPTFVQFKLPQVGQPVQNAFIKFKVDPSAATLTPPVRGRLKVVHGNGTINISNVPVQTNGDVLFQAQPGGPTLGPVSLVEIDIL